MGEWHQTKIGELLTLHYGKGLKGYQEDVGEYDVFGTNGRIGSTDRYLFDKPSLIIGRKGAYRGVKLATKPFFVIDTAFYTTPKLRDVDTNFLFYWFQTVDINEMDSGSAIPSTSRDEVYDVDISLPPIVEQKAIAEVLASLDDKIDLLHRQNKTLEALAETLFRQTFIENAQDDWEEKSLKEICSIRNGYAFKSSTYHQVGEKIVRTLNFSNGFLQLNNLVFIPPVLAKKFEKYYLDRKDFLLVMVGAALGKHAIVTSDILPALQNQNMWCFRAHQYHLQHYLNYALRELVKNNLHSASGSARQFFQKAAFYKYEIPVPDKKVLDVFNASIDDFFAKTESNRRQIITLVKLRDLLLPKLMSGEVRVEYDEATLEKEAPT